MKIKILPCLAIALVTPILVSTAAAEVFSEAAKTGANAGAMKYCRDHVASKEDRDNYKLLAIKTLKKYDKLDPDEKAKALVYRKAAEDGDYLGDRLTTSRCDSLRKLLYLE